MAHLELKEAEVETYRHPLDETLTYVENEKGRGQSMVARIETGSESNANNSERRSHHITGESSLLEPHTP